MFFSLNFMFSVSDALFFVCSAMVVITAHANCPVPLLSSPNKPLLEIKTGRDFLDSVAFSTFTTLISFSVYYVVITVPFFLTMY